MRPRRRSVGWGWCAAGTLPREGCLRIVPVLGMRRLCANRDETTIAPLSRHDSHTHVGGLGRVGQKAHRNEVDASLGVGANVVEANSAGTLNWNVAAGFVRVGERAPR